MATKEGHSQLRPPEAADKRSAVNSFTEVAPYYDHLMAGVPYRFWVEYVTGIFRAHAMAPKSILDLACGTGSAAFILAEQGIRVTGVDLSEAMISVARKKARGRRREIDFYAQDAAELDLSEQFDAVISLFDSLNNITEPDRLAMAFTRVYDHLAEPGIFVFDLNTEVAFSAGMFNQKSGPIDGPLQYVWRASYDAPNRMCTVHMRFTFKPDGADEPRVFEEVHRQRAYGKDEIEAMLRASGFSEVVIYDAYSFKPAKKRSDRLFFVALKPLRLA